MDFGPSDVYRTVDDGSELTHFATCTLGKVLSYETLCGTQLMVCAIALWCVFLGFISKHPQVTQKKKRKKKKKGVNKSNSKI